MTENYIYAHTHQNINVDNLSYQMDGHMIENYISAHQNMQINTDDVETVPE